MDKRGELLSQLMEEFGFDTLAIVGVKEDEEELHVMTSGNLSDVEGVLLLLDGVAFLTTADHTPPVTH